MQTIEISLASVLSLIGTAVGGYVVWSAKQLINNMNDNFKDFQSDINHKCSEHEGRLDDHERCLLKIAINHKNNHQQDLGCDL